MIFFGNFGCFGLNYNGSQRHTGRRLSPTIQMIHLIFPPHVRRSGVTAWLPVRFGRYHQQIAKTVIAPDPDRGHRNIFPDGRKPEPYNRAVGSNPSVPI